MNRRSLLAGAAAAPFATLPGAALSLPTVNGTDAVWPAYLEAKAAADAAEASIDAADAALAPEFRSGTPLVFVQHGEEEPREMFTRYMVEAEREDDPIIVNGLGGPDAIARRHAYYDRLAAELAEKKTAREEARRHFEPLYARLDELLAPLSDAENAVIDAPLLTLEDAVRKLTAAETMFAEEDNLPGRVALDVLEGLRRLTAANPAA